MNQRGFTLVELMTAVAIMAIIATLALPSFRNLINSNKATSTAEELVNSLGVGKSEALQRNGVVTICPSTNSTTSSPTCSTTNTDWKSGWLVFVDGDNDGSYSSTSDTLLRRGSPASNLTSLTSYNEASTCTSVALVKFRSFINLGGSALVFKVVAGNTTKWVKVDRLGRITLPATSSC